MATLTCDKSLELVLPCIHCESEQESLAIRAHAWAMANGFDVSTSAGSNSLIQASSCVACLSQKQMDDALTAVLINRFHPPDTVTNMRQHARFLATKPKSVNQALILYLQCLYWKTH